MHGTSNRHGASGNMLHQNHLAYGKGLRSGSREGAEEEAETPMEED